MLSGASSDEFTKPAMQAMNEQLVDSEAGLLRLLTPPLATSENNPGYIQAYPPGVRENGGQYSRGRVGPDGASAIRRHTSRVGKLPGLEPGPPQPAPHAGQPMSWSPM